jgi:hypothetical protein
MLSTAVTLTGLIWTRYSTQINPINYNLMTVNAFMAVTGIYQLSRKFRCVSVCMACMYGSLYVSPCQMHRRIRVTWVVEPFCNSWMCCNGQLQRPLVKVVLQGCTMLGTAQALAAGLSAHMHAPMSAC